ncbi:MAG: HipA N-terminal domain-containing protein, partial [Sphingopyxis sp.]|nr:HipA N-terminal domain-containing protein [Sphingopyxis sp.]
MWGFPWTPSDFPNAGIRRRRPDMNREIDVHIDWQGSTILVGNLWARSKGNRQTSSFEYVAEWIGRVDSFALAPDPPLSSGQFHSAGLFNAFTDPAPDRWGLNLLARRERKSAQAEKRQPRTLLDIDYLTLVDDKNRLGALRFAETGTVEFLATGDQVIPPLVTLGRLLSAATRIIDDKESDDDLKRLLAPGASLGGARPVHSTSRSSSCRRPSDLQSDHQPHAERPPALHHHGRDWYEDDIDKALGVMRELMMGDPRAI